MYSLAADLRDGRDAVSMTHAPIFFAVAEQRPGAFEPTYEWQEVAQGQSVPSGLDVRRHAMPPAPVPIMAETGLARMPRAWMSPSKGEVELSS